MLCSAGNCASDLPGSPDRVLFPSNPVRNLDKSCCSFFSPVWGRAGQSGAALGLTPPSQRYISRRARSWQPAGSCSVPQIGQGAHAPHSHCPCWLVEAPQSAQVYSLLIFSLHQIRPSHHTAPIAPVKPFRLTWDNSRQPPAPVSSPVSPLDGLRQPVSTNGMTLTTEQAARVLGVHPRTMKRWRSEHNGPAYTKLHAHQVRYSPADIKRWLAERRHD